MNVWVVILVLVLIAACCWGTRELFPKYVHYATDTVGVKSIPVPVIQRDSALMTSYFELQTKYGKLKGSLAWLKHLADSLSSGTHSNQGVDSDMTDIGNKTEDLSRSVLSAVLDTVLPSKGNCFDSIHVAYALPPSNYFHSLRIVPCPIEIRREVVYVDKEIEKKQFLGGYPEKILYFVAGYGTAKLFQGVQK